MIDEINDSGGQIATERRWGAKSAAGFGSWLWVLGWMECPLLHCMTTQPRGCWRVRLDDESASRAKLMYV